MIPISRMPYSLPCFASVLSALMLSLTLTFLPSIINRFFFTFGLNLRFVWRCEWLIVLPALGLFPVIEQTLLMIEPLSRRPSVYTMFYAFMQGPFGLNPAQ